MLDIFSLSDNLHRVLMDRMAIERRCVPNSVFLEKVMNAVKKSGKNLIISTLSLKDYKSIFQFMIKAHNYELNNTLPTDEEFALMVKTFEYVIEQNNRKLALFDSDDLWVLCLMFNIISCHKNKNAYMTRFRAWRV